MSTVATAATSNRVVTMQDIANKTGYSLTTVSQCMRAKSSLQYKQSTVDKIRMTAKELGYNARMARAYRDRSNHPANPVFASRAAETAAMHKLRNDGNSNREVAHRCGVCVATVRKRIGEQPDVISSANRKLAGKIRSAKAKIKKAYVQQQTVAEYNELAAKLNAQLEEAKKMATELSAMQKKAKIASKATNVPLLRVLQGGVAS